MYATPAALPWNWEDIDFSRIDGDLVREHEELFLLICSASFIESGSDTYTRNLANYFADDEEVGAWLRDHWEPEELHHGRALKAYVQHVWPEFDWERAYAEFAAEYSKLSTLEYLEPTRGREMAARCIVEMGTTTYYQALSACCQEPVLRELTWRIRCDEVRHYKHFYAYFLKYCRVERLNWPQVLAALVRRLIELRQDDAAIALGHVAAWRPQGAAAPGSRAELIRQCMDVMRPNYPADLAVRMTLKPLQLGPLLQRLTQRPLTLITRYALLR